MTTSVATHMRGAVTTTLLSAAAILLTARGPAAAAGDGVRGEDANATQPERDAR